jgi:hypothetical protein
VRALLSVVCLLLVATGCAKEAVDARPTICSPEMTRSPCASARVGVDYPTALFTHCGVRWAYFDGRYWVIDPPQPEGANLVYGVMTLLSANELAFDGEDGRRYAFKRAPASFSPPLCY